MSAITRSLTAAVLLHMALCVDIPAPVHLVLSSQHFVHSLSWEKGPGSPDGVHYNVTVQRLSRGVLVEVVKECENVTSPLRCNLTEALSDVKETYYIRVTAVLGGRTSRSHCQPFRPIQNTTLEPPLLAVSACNRSLCVSLSAPAEKLHSLYSSHELRYRLMVSSEDGGKFQVDTEGLKNVPLKDLAPGQRYCVNVSIIDHHTSHSPPVCAYVPKAANVSDAVISVVLCLLILLLLMCSPRLISHFFCLKPQLPAVLRSFESGNKVILITPAELTHPLFEDGVSVQKMKRNGEEKDMETEEDVKYERIVAHYLDAQGSALIVFPVSSSPHLSPDADPSLSSSTDAQSPNLIVFEDGHVQTTEPTASPQGTSPLQSLSIAVPTHVDDGEGDADVNLFSVTLGEASAERHVAEPEESCSIKDELGSDPPSLLQTESRSQNYSGKHILEEEEEDEEEEDDECSGYLSRY